MPFIAAMSWDAETKRVTKYLLFDTRGEAEAHVAAFADRYPDAIAAEYSGPIPEAVVDPVAKSVSAVPVPPEPAPILEAQNGLALQERAKKKARALSLLAQGKADEAMKELLELL